MAVDIGPRIGIDGEAQFRKELKNVNQSLKTLGSEMKVVTSEFDGQKKSAEQLKRENDVLERSVLTLKDKLKLQEDALEKCARQYGEADEKTMKWQQAVNETRAALNKAENEIKSNTNAMRNLGNEADDASKKTSSFGDVFRGVFSAEMLKQGLEIAVDIIRAVGKAAIDAAEETAQFADDILTLSTVTGLSTKQLQEFEYMADLIDVDVDTFAKAVAKLTKNMSTARKGTGAAAEAFEKLGISITDTTTGELRDSTTVLFEVLDALGQVANETERDAIAMDIFGKSAQELNPAIVAGSEAMAKYAEEAQKFGRVYSEEELNKLNAYKDGMGRLKSSWEGLKSDFVVANIDKLSNAISTATGFVVDLRDELAENGLMSTFLKLDGAILKHMPMWTVLKGAISLVKNEIQAVIEWFDKLKAKLAGGVPSVGTAASSGGGKKSAPTININPKTMSKSDTDYVVNYANRAFGGSI